MDPHELRTLIKLARIARGWRQLDLGRAIGTSNVRVGQIELGYAKPRPDELQRIATALGLDGLRELAAKARR